MPVKTVAVADVSMKELNAMLGKTVVDTKRLLVVTDVFDPLHREGLAGASLPIGKDCPYSAATRPANYNQISGSISGSSTPLDEGC